MSEKTMPADERTVEQKNELRLSREIRDQLSARGYTVVDETVCPIGLHMLLVGPTCEPYSVFITALPKTAHEPLEEV